MLAVNDVASAGKIHPVSYEINRGKGGAIKAGVAAAKGDYIGFLDADLDISADHIVNYYQTILDEKCDVIIGSKMQQMSIIRIPPFPYSITLVNVLLFYFFKNFIFCDELFLRK